MTDRESYLFVLEIKESIQNSVINTNWDSTYLALQALYNVWGNGPQLIDPHRSWFASKLQELTSETVCSDSEVRSEAAETFYTYMVSKHKSAILRKNSSVTERERAAVTFVSAVWRGYCTRRRWKRMRTACEKIQGCWRR
jgi:hypothetical protein